ncbi:MAG: sodium-translocating pyrophosphatase [Endomicrobia bacterium]|nr:sodium-translocating pyrophosphatase [Endomicrobiia bacterium]MDW8055583.1 sodium-translocating pyrophosphatase [Elusimicrobiota bacterium]
MIQTIIQQLTTLPVTLLSGIAGMLFVWYLSRRVLSADPGTERMQTIAGLVRKGAIAFLSREYKTVSYFLVALFIIIFFGIAKKTAIAFIIGAICSMLAGVIGMNISTLSSSRTAKKCELSFNDALGIAFPGGAVMGLSVVGLGLLGLSLVYIAFIWYLLTTGSDLTQAVSEATAMIVGFSMGASSIALFARVGGGIYTKAADVGADLVGKVEKGIPEDDPRNPAVIADNVGDNVGDVAGMGADLYESYVGAIVSGLIIAVFNLRRIDSAMLCLLLAVAGLISSAISVFFVRTKKDEDPQVVLNKGLIASLVIFTVLSLVIVITKYKDIGAFWAVMSGLAAGMLVGFTAQYYTSGKTVVGVAEQARTGPATVIIEGTAVGMLSTVVPLVAIAIATVIAYKLQGVFGIALSAIGMLALTGTTVAIDAYGPIADNAAGIAEMAHMGAEVRRRAERLDAVGNTTAAVGKGFAIGSAALTALALFSAYAETVGLGAQGLNILDAKVIAGMFIGCVIPFFLISKTLQAVGRAAYSIVEEVRRQFREIPGLLEGTALPDSARCVDITTQAALKKMILPGLSAVVVPAIVGIVLGKESLGGFLAGALLTGVPLAIYLANSGGAWDNAKKHIEEGNFGGKGSEPHKASVVGDTVGDPFKDTSGPSLNILLKLMSVVSLVFGGLFIKINEWLISILPFLK